MSKYSILLQQDPQPFEIPAFCQNGFFFNESKHLCQQNEGCFHLLTALNRITRRAEARCAFFMCSGEAVSPAAAPFGSIEFAETLPEPVLNDFLHSLVDVARLAEAATLRIVNYPNCYAPEQANRLTINLMNHGFRQIEANQNFFLPITDQAFSDTIASAERRRLRKCREAGFQVNYGQMPNVNEMIAFLQETRRQKGYPLTINPERLRELLTNFPNQFTVFTVNDGDKLIAVTITVRVRPDILYNFLPASHPDYQTFSPTVMLTDTLYSYCQKQGIRLLDLGISLDHNRQPKPGLMRFKRNLGAQESPKLVFEKQL